VHEYREPILRIFSASEQASGAPIPRVTLTDLRIDGRRVDDLRSFLANGFAQGASVQGDTLICTVECAFGVRPGNYEFTAAAPGFVPQQANLPVRYAVETRGCPSSSAGSTRLSLALAAQ